MRVVICWRNISGYAAACWRALHARSEVDLSVIAFWPREEGRGGEYDDDVVRGIPCRLLDHRERQDAGLVASLVREAGPDVIYVSGWLHKAYDKLLWNRDFASAKFMMGMDTPWWATWRQRLARLRIGRNLARVDRVLVCGERSWQAARNMGVPEARIRRCCLYGVDCAMWEPLLQKRADQPGGWPRRFLFMGRYVEVKALDVLLEAYGLYRSRVDDPWTLSCCGKGPLEHVVDAAEGVKNCGFVQPSDLPAVLVEHGVFVNAARYDPWPLVIVEACAAGLPVIASEACGSIVELIRPWYNGITVATGDAEALARAMVWMHEHYEQLPEMGRRGQSHAAAFSAEAWAERWVNVVREMF